MNENLGLLWNKRPFIISGPCSAETENQVVETAIRLAQTGKIDLFRAGIWKPRTKPGMFEGIGSKGLPWLKEVKLQTGLPVAVEVASARHVDEAMQHGVDVLWIGARTTVNPFSVQEIADALKGCEIPVFIKNPLNPDLDLWVGAIERIEKSGINHIGIIHRGFSSYGNTQFRNPPIWQLAIEMKRKFPQFLSICDPSHICGNRIMLQEIAQKSIDLDFNGLMIESHIDPDNAWSDAFQQITPEQLDLLLNNLIWRVSKSVSQEQSNPLIHLREHIDSLDDELITLLGQRMNLADKIGLYKKEKNITILQTERWEEILKRAIDKAKHLGLSDEFVTQYLEAVHLESINHQNKVMNG